MHCLRFSQGSLQEQQEEETPSYSILFPGFQQRSTAQVETMLAAHHRKLQEQEDALAEESQPLTSDSQQETPQHLVNQMMAMPAVSLFTIIHFDLICFRICWQLDVKLSSLKKKKRFLCLYKQKKCCLFVLYVCTA